MFSYQSVHCQVGLFVIADLNLILSSIMSLIAAVYCFVMFYNFLIAMALLIKDQAIDISRMASHFWSVWLVPFLFIFHCHLLAGIVNAIRRLSE